jgi:hypothetical protein
MEKHPRISYPPKQSANSNDIIGKLFATLLVFIAIILVKALKHFPVAKNSCDKEPVKFVTGISGVCA